MPKKKKTLSEDASNTYRIQKLRQRIKHNKRHTDVEARLVIFFLVSVTFKTKLCLAKEG